MRIFSYFNVNAANIRNRIETGGGAVYDIGCYCIQGSRFAFGQEPRRVVALVDRDAQMGTDRLASAILDFRVRPGDLYLQHAADPVSARADFWARAAASNLRFPSMRPATGLRGSSSTRPAT